MTVRSRTSGVNASREAPPVPDGKLFVHIFTHREYAYKFEVKDAIPYNASLMNQMGLVVAINSDDAEMARRLNQEVVLAPQDAKVIKKMLGK